MEQIKKAIYHFTKAHPFFFGICYKWNIKPDEKIDTMATNGIDLLFNPDFVASLDNRALLFVIAHEASHIFFKHHLRLLGRDLEIANIAADHVSNLFLQSIGYQVPDDCYCDIRFTNWSFERVYNFLIKEQQGKKQNQKQQDNSQGQAQNQQSSQNSQSGQNGQGQSPQNPVPGQTFIYSPSQSEEEIKQVEQELQGTLQQSAQMIKIAGQGQGALQNWINSQVKTKTNWRDILSNFLSQFDQSDYSYKKPNQQYVQYGLYCPSLHSEKLGKVFLAIDTSGSETREDILKSINQVSELCNEFMQSVDLALFDDDVYSFFPEFTAETKIDKIRQGGTNFKPIFDFIAAEDLTPDVVIILTDGYNQDKNALVNFVPDYSVIWLIQGIQYKCNFGEIIFMED